MKLLWQPLPNESIFLPGGKVRIREGTPREVRTFHKEELEIGRKGIILSASKIAPSLLYIDFESFNKPSEKFRHSTYPVEQDGWLMRAVHLELI